MDLGLKGKKALVLGSSSGLGKAVACQLSEEGAEVVISGRSRERAQQALIECKAKAVVNGDLSCVGEAERLVEEAVQLLGGLDIIVINGGGGQPGGLLTSAPDNRESAYYSMLRPALEAAVCASRYLKESASGRMIFITARSVVEATPELALSSIFRSGVAAAARSLAIELAPDDVLVNVVVPGQFETPAYERFENWTADHQGVAAADIREMHEKAIPLGRLGQATELSDIITFLCSARASYITGSVVRVDGGAVTGFH